MATLLNETDLIDRILAHIDGKTTDKGSVVWCEPVENYHSPERFAAEIEVLRRVPMAFCPSAALPEPGSYIARTTVGTPLLVVRGTDGVVRGFRNACRHRGMKLEEGEGCKRAFACPYHAWTYGLDGSLRHVPGEDGFPGLDKATHGLVPVASVQERNGIVFVTQDEPLSDGPLGDLPDVLTDDYVLFNKIEFDDKANWKVLGETSMEGYHIKALHNQSFFPYGYDNLNVVELHGRNSRIVFPFRRIEKLRNVPREEWSTQGRITDVHQLFPNTHVSVLSSHAILIILEPVSPSETHWVVYQLAPRIKNGKPLDIEQARKDANFVQESGILEDRHAAREIQAGLASGANTHFTFGHYEQAIGHFHRHLAEHVEMLKAGRR
ncbi:aromatic ring-hydroxylating oxygenase subunit alpha [Reyranella sp.]|uniref:aromatic ring-hydroxylating oxygenase subunit alpha n=1 Tax=Reyranella sp. TaxID=1929291 RepID=UPI003BA9F4B2